MTPREFKINGDKHLSEKMYLTGREIMQKSRIPTQGKALMLLGGKDAEDRIVSENETVQLPFKATPSFVTVPKIKLPNP